MKQKFVICSGLIMACIAGCTHPPESMSEQQFWELCREQYFGQINPPYEASSSKYQLVRSFIASKPAQITSEQCAKILGEPDAIAPWIINSDSWFIPRRDLGSHNIYWLRITDTNSLQSAPAFAYRREYLSLYIDRSNRLDHWEGRIDGRLVSSR